MSFQNVADHFWDLNLGFAVEQFDPLLPRNQVLPRDVGQTRITQRIVLPSGVFQKVISEFDRPMDSYELRYDFAA